MTVLEQYQIQFYIKNILGSDYKQIKTINTWLSAYIYSFNKVHRVNNLLDRINNVLDGSISDAGGQTQTMYYGVITISEIKIYQDYEAWEQDNSITPDFTMPTLDFKEIIEAWKTFLE